MTMYNDIPAADNLLKICEGIILARVEKDLVKEEMLYFWLIDILRSGDLMLKVTGRYVK